MLIITMCYGVLIIVIILVSIKIRVNNILRSKNTIINIFFLIMMISYVRR